jgi:hypothetical protein
VLLFVVTITILVIVAIGGLVSKVVAYGAQCFAKMTAFIGCMVILFTIGAMNFQTFFTRDAIGKRGLFGNQKIKLLSHLQHFILLASNPVVILIFEFLVEVDNAELDTVFVDRNSGIKFVDECIPCNG